MNYLKVKITRVDEISYPGFIECIFNDAYGKEWEVLEKMPHIFSEDIAFKELPISGFFIPGDIIVKKDRNIVSFMLKYPIAADDGVKVFDVFVDQLSGKQNMSI